MRKESTFFFSLMAIFLFFFDPVAHAFSGKDNKSIEICISPDSATPYPSDQQLLDACKRLLKINGVDQHRRLFAVHTITRIYTEYKFFNIAIIYYNYLKQSYTDDIFGLKMACKTAAIVNKTEDIIYFCENLHYYDYDPDPMTYLYLGNALVKEKNYDEAAEAFEEAGDSIYVKEALVDALIKAGRHRKAKRIAKRYKLNIEPEKDASEILENSEISATLKEQEIATKIVDGEVTRGRRRAVIAYCPAMNITGIATNDDPSEAGIEAYKLCLKDVIEGSGGSASLSCCKLVAMTNTANCVSVAKDHRGLLYHAEESTPDNASKIALSKCDNQNCTLIASKCVSDQ